MSLSPTCTQGEPRTDPMVWPDLGPLRWPYLAFDLPDIAASAEPAACLTKAGVLWEYDGERFLVTDIVAGAWRRPAEGREAAPPGPWRHLPACICEPCRLGNV